MANKHKFHRTARNRVVDLLVDTHNDLGHLTRFHYSLAAQDSGYSIRHLQRIVAQKTKPDATTKKEFTVDEGVTCTVFNACGNIAAAWQALRKQPEYQTENPLPSLSTFRRRVWDDLGAHSIAVARKGPRVSRDVRVHLPSDTEERGATYLLDHTELPIFIIPDGTLTARRPWLTAVMDAGSRYVLSWVLTTDGTPSSEEVRAALIRAFDLRYAPDGQTVVGGLPDRAVWDRGLDFLSDLVTQSCLRLGVAPFALPAYSPHLKGSLERFWRHLKSNALAPLAGYIDSGVDVRGQYLLAANALSEQAFLTELGAWIDWHNTEHEVRTLGCTPLQAWQEGRTPLRDVPTDRLWQDFLLSDQAHKVGKSGVRHKKVNYVDVDGALNKYIGRNVEVRYLPQTRDFIEVFHDGKHVATCYPADSLRPEDRLSFLEGRCQAQHDTQRQFAAASRQRAAHPGAVELIEQTGPGRKKTRVATGIRTDLLNDLDKRFDQIGASHANGQGSLL